MYGQSSEKGACAADQAGEQGEAFGENSQESEEACKDGGEAALSLKIVVIDERRTAFTYFHDYYFLQDYKYVLTLIGTLTSCLLYTSPSPRDLSTSRMPSSA